MLITKKDRRTIYERLFQHGVLVAHKDFNAVSHCELKSVRNLHVIKAMQSLKSRGSCASSLPGGIFTGT